MDMFLIEQFKLSKEVFLSNQLWKHRGSCDRHNWLLYFCTE